MQQPAVRSRPVATIPIILTKKVYTQPHTHDTGGCGVMVFVRGVYEKENDGQTSLPPPCALRQIINSSFIQNVPPLNRSSFSSFYQVLLLLLLLALFFISKIDYTWPLLSYSRRAHPFVVPSLLVLLFFCPLQSALHLTSALIVPHANTTNNLPSFFVFLLCFLHIHHHRHLL